MKTFEELVGSTLKSVTQDSDDQLVFTLDNSDTYLLGSKYDDHSQFKVLNMIGDLSKIIGSPIIESSVNRNVTQDDGIERETIVEYSITTANETYSFNWQILSDGYTSEEMSFKRIEPLYNSNVRSMRT